MKLSRRRCREVEMSDFLYYTIGDEPVPDWFDFIIKRKIIKHDIRGGFYSDHHGYIQEFKKGEKLCMAKWFYEQEKEKVNKMPSSSNVGKSEILAYLEGYFRGDKKSPKFLDIGCGQGTYAHLLRSEGYANIDGVEGCQKYVDEFGLRSKYNKLNVCKVQDFEATEHYDVAIFGDVLEHLEVEEAQKVISYFKNIILPGVIIASVPYKLPQDAWGGNELEIHRQADLTRELFLQRYPGFRLLHEGVHEEWLTIGTFVCEL
jgi:SAM-dependent methyltransferase